MGVLYLCHNLKLIKKSLIGQINITEVQMEFIKTFEGDKVFKVGVRDLLGAAVDAIVNPANSCLSHGGGLAAIISNEAGPKIDNHCEKYIKKYGRIPVTKAVATTAGRLPYKCVVHAVGPRMGNGDEQTKIEATLTSCLGIAHTKEWSSVAFPAISTGLFCVPKDACAEAFKNAVPGFWEKHPDSSVELVWLCLTIDDYPVFEKILSQSL
jgi:O-acetyl-ADP-ribose deacetylase (regulator of RNase III)